MTCWDPLILPSPELAAIGTLLVENSRRQGCAAKELASFQLQSKCASPPRTLSEVFLTRHIRNLPTHHEDVTMPLQLGRRLAQGLY